MNVRFELNSPLQTYEISGFMYCTYCLKVWFALSPHPTSLLYPHHPHPVGVQEEARHVPARVRAQRLDWACRWGNPPLYWSP